MTKIKKGIVALLLMANLLSCTSVKVSSKNNFDYSALKENAEYTVHKVNGSKIKKFQFIKEQEGEIIGVVDKEQQVISKDEIQKISKMSEGKTILLVVVGVVLAIFIPAYVNNKPVL